MFKKEMQEKVAGYDQNIDMIKRAINSYFQTNETPNKDFEIETIGDKVVNFIVSVDGRIKRLKEELEKNVFESEERKTLIGELKEDIESKAKIVEQQSAIIKAQDKEIETLTKAKSATAKGEKNNGI